MTNLADDQHLVSGEDQDDGTDEEKWTEGVNHGSTHNDHDTTEEDGAKNTPEKHAVLCGLGVHLHVHKDQYSHFKNRSGRASA